MKMALDELDMTSILMSTSGLDWEVTDPELIASAVVESIEPGSIILLHDGHGDVSDPNAQGSRAASVVKYAATSGAQQMLISGTQFGPVSGTVLGADNPVGATYANAALSDLAGATYVVLAASTVVPSQFVPETTAHRALNADAASAVDALRDSVLVAIVA